ncbi:hypothetical protein ACWEPM_38350, partial [Streptomyces sp. NPDC004244]
MGRSRLLIQESEAGKPGGKLLIESESPERENAKAKNPESEARNTLIEWETQERKPGGKPERVSTKEAS